MVVHAFNPALKKLKQVDICEFKTSLVYIVLGQLMLCTETLSQKGGGRNGELCLFYCCDKIPGPKQLIKESMQFGI